MTQAIFGLVGVIVGALVTGGVSFVRDRRRESADLRAALRLVEDDFHLLLMGLRAMAKAGVWHPRILTMELTSWPEHRGILASHLSSDDWLRVSVGASIFAAARSGAERGFAAQEGDDLPALTDEDREVVEKGVNDLDEIVSVMQSLHSPPAGLIGLLRWRRVQRKRERARLAPTESADHPEEGECTSPA